VATPASRYSVVAIWLHWAIATAIFGNFAIGWWMHSAIDVPASQARAVAAFQIHKSLGLSILFLSVLRLAWRLFNPPPPMPAQMPAWQQTFAKLTHWAFYGLMLAIPLSGWLYVSTQWRDGAPLQVPTLWFGWFEVPHLFGLNHAAAGLRAGVAGFFEEAHEFLARAIMLLAALHVGAALKHHFIGRDPVLTRMAPGLRVPGKAKYTARSRNERITLGVGFTVILLLTIIVTSLLFLPPAQEVESSGNQLAEISNTAESWIIDPAKSSIRFSGVHAGKAFNGVFTRWEINAQIVPAAVAKSSISAYIATASAADGVKLHNTTLPQQEWFNVARYPRARFTTTEITRVRDNQYHLAGTLQIKNKTIAVPQLSLSVNAQTATIQGTFTIDRAQANLGMESDPEGRWVSREITVTVNALLHSP